MPLGQFPETLNGYFRNDLPNCDCLTGEGFSVSQTQFLSFFAVRSEWLPVNGGHSSMALDSVASVRICFKISDALAA